MRFSSDTPSRRARLAQLPLWLGVATAGTAAGIACGAAPARPVAKLAAAGSQQDDGSGLLARLSRPTPDGKGGDAAGDVTYDSAYSSDDYYGGLIYGVGYGGVGGVLYGNYQPPYGGYYTGTGATPFRADYIASGVVNGGSIVGVVSWPRPPAAPPELALGVDRGDCAARVVNPTLAIDAAGHVGGAVVYLADIRVGKTLPQFSRVAQLGGELERRDCALRPQLQLVAPINSMVQLNNADEVKAHFVATRSAEASIERAFEAELGRGGSRSVNIGINGFVRVADEASGGVAAWMIVQDHPYYAITDDRGEFRFDDVPSGTYELVVWQQPVATGNADGAIVYGNPVVQRSKVTVKAGQAQAVAVKLP